MEEKKLFKVSSNPLVRTKRDTTSIMLDVIIALIPALAVGTYMFGIKVVLPKMDAAIVLFAVLMVVTAILSKLVGCGLGAKLCGFTNRECLQTGFGMACRGEVALIVANKGVSLGLMPPAFFGPVIITVVCCAVLTPVLLKLVFRSKKEDAYVGMRTSGLVDRIEENDQLDILSDRLLDEHHRLRKSKHK